MRALIVTNMYPTDERPAFGSFVRDQVQALGRIADVELDVFVLPHGGPAAYLRGARQLRGRRPEHFDVVHAHFGLSAWPALAVSGRVRAVTLHGTDLADPRSRRITLAALALMDLVATVSEPLAAEIPRWAAHRSRLAVLPCGVDMRRFRPIPRAQARAALGLEPTGPYLLFPADPQRPEKRHDLALALAGEVRLLTLGNIAPAEVPLWVNAANAVLVPSEREGFGLAVLEALACNVPVLATPVGIAPEALAGIPGTHCGPFDLSRWRQAVAPHLAAQEPRVPGRAGAEQFSTDRMAARVHAAWQELLDEPANRRHRRRWRGRRIYSRRSLEP